ncbi:efflux MFS transporter YdeE [Morganella morganii]|uniref:efflux MFS transporter YdeE n=1 Tax=Morganella morganii TaxID=582 RepID=UPI001BD3AB1E|nr:efflux MFS transporter YdeE [Morganella morganii]MBS9585213.1 efflux MFS transporter YdeE [Morganella morganii subsp. morganii]QWL87025.1 efflux MFS transporter YdeE [Morganella morganii subsp. morganii]
MQAATRSTIALLASSFLITIGRGATIPFMAIYLSRQYDMAVDQVGVALTVALTTGVLFSLGFGIIADKFDKKRYMLMAILVYIAGFIAIPLTHNIALVVVFFSLINCAYSVFATVLKAYFADTLPPARKTKVFSLNYTFVNMGWTVGPPIGTGLLMYSADLPFWLAACTASFPIFFIQRFVRSMPPSASGSNSTTWQPSVMLHDKALLWFTLSAFLGSLVFGSFSACISQYVLTVADTTLAEKVIGVVLPVNAAVVVSLQYMVGRRISTDNLQKLMTLGTLFFMAGLAGFMMSGSNLVFWGIAAFVFTLGELIYAPGEYMLIDNIAPDGMKSSYFSAQSLGWLGGAFNPLMTGGVLTYFPPNTLWLLLIGVSACAWLCMMRGLKISRNRLIHQ